MTQYVAFLRGINVGGHKKIKMQDLRHALTADGFEDVKTFLASGNVLFRAESQNPEAISDRIETIVEISFGFKAGVIVRPLSELQELEDLDPFGEIDVTKDTRLYVSFLPARADSELQIPFESPGGNFRIILRTDNAVCSILNRSKDKGTLDLMDLLESEFGRDITTRNWNTIQKILSAYDE